MDKHRTTGIYCNKTRKFYYLIEGAHSAAASIDKLRVLLMARNVIDMMDQSSPITGYRFMNLHEAELADHPTEGIYLTKHAERSAEPKAHSPSSGRLDMWD